MSAPQQRDAVVVFPGQGAQRPGMARDFCETFAVARDAFAEASEALNLDMGTLCLGEDGRLDLTEFAQPAILTAEIAMYRVLTREFGLHGHFFGGHSLGEYTALCAAGVIPLAEAVRIVRRRGAAMQRAVPVGQGGMIAVSGTGAKASVTTELAAELGLDIASINSPDQVVLSGLHAALAVARAELTSRGYELASLEVSAPFHSRFMSKAAPDLRTDLERALPRFTPANAGVVASNADGGFHVPDSRTIVEALVRQLTSPVRWLDNMNVLIQSPHRIFEIGPSRPLRGLFRGVGQQVCSITSRVSAEREFCA